MKQELIDRAVLIGRRANHVFIATSDKSGLPHIAAAGRIGSGSAGAVEISEWFCAGTLANLQVNPVVSIVVWDPEYDVGWQILGDCTRVEEIAVMDGFTPGQDERAPVPQVERKIYVGVSKIIHFSRAPHSDLEE